MRSEVVHEVGKHPGRPSSSARSMKFSRERPTRSGAAAGTQVVDAPEVLTIIDTMPALASFLNSLHGCRYKDFFLVRPPMPPGHGGAANAICNRRGNSSTQEQALILRCTWDLSAR